MNQSNLVHDNSEGDNKLNNFLHYYYQYLLANESFVIKTLFIS
ncbi:30161_t:CDS:2 [Gigaspora margarita]|uniref:30161_t:CDS:1 n=1 Tax=Gigaspora margarita TaxID=4874 RepID=A0ABM8W3G4_GIGMA|nr:30161_t:CDS:2 [Gigaspora margarita]